MEPQDFVDRGIIQDYCLGLLGDTAKAKFETELANYPELLEELTHFQKGMENYISDLANDSATGNLKERIWCTLENIVLEQHIDLEKLPVINKFSDSNAWLAAVKHLLPDEVGEEQFTYTLKDTPLITQLLVKSATDFEDEIHTDYLESILILKGSCVCNIGGQSIGLDEGEYLDIPINEIHNAEVKSPYVVVLIQRVVV
jgi:mannose-6-phosphate isomerase-like protein (cupin superfamily)